jgi:predicted ATP-grasp superfamily ATP-dependent carboligase
LRLLIVEFVTGGGFAGGMLPESLAAEGEMMLQAVLHDLHGTAGLGVLVARDARLSRPPAWCEVIDVEDAPWARWAAAADAVDAVLPIAPETDGLLERLNGLVVARGRRLLGCDPAAVHVAASKTRTAAALQRAGIEVIPTSSDANRLPASAHGWVVKPDEGAGSEHTYHLRDAAAVRARMESTEIAAPVVQPFVPGEAISLSLLCAPGRVRLLACNRQLQTRAGDALRQSGVVVNGAIEHAATAEPLAERLSAALPGLLGYVGVDLIVGASGPVVLEVNPRLTTAYAGLSASIGCNAFELVRRACANDASVFDVPLERRSVEVRAHG